MATIKIIRTDDEFRALKPEWDKIFAQNPDARVFQSFDWNYCGWMNYHKRHFPESRLYILHMTRDGHVDQKAIVPGCLFPDGRFELLMQMISDVVDIIEPPHSENWHNFYADLAKFLKESSEIKRLFVFHLLPTSNFLRYVGVYFEHVRIARMDAFSYLTVRQTDDFVGSLQHLTSKERSYVRSLGKKNTGGAYKLYSALSGEAFPKDALRTLRDWMCQHGMRKYSFFPDETLDFIGDVYACGKCDVSVLQDPSGDFLEASFRIYAGSHVNFWVVLYKESFMTTLVDACYMANRAKQGDCVFDFGTGAYAYKLGTYRPEVEHLYTLYTYTLSFRHFYQECKEALRQYVKGLLGRA